MVCCVCCWQDDPMTNLNTAFDVAEKYLDIPKMLDAEGEQAGRKTVKWWWGGHTVLFTCVERPKYTLSEVQFRCLKVMRSSFQDMDVGLHHPIIYLIGQVCTFSRYITWHVHCWITPVASVSAVLRVNVQEENWNYQNLDEVVNKRKRHMMRDDGWTLFTNCLLIFWHQFLWDCMFWP